MFRFYGAWVAQTGHDANLKSLQRETRDRHTIEALDEALAKVGPPAAAPYKPKAGSLVAALREIAEEFRAQGLEGRVIDPPHDEAPPVPGRST
jgi:hypothetical protein